MATQKSYIQTLSKFSPWGGETCDGESPRLSCSNILSEGRDFSLAYLNADYYTGFINTWKSEGCYAEVARSMGHRIQLDSVTLPATAAKGTTLNIPVELRNLGWARMISQRKMVISLRNTANGALIQGTASSDLRLALAPKMTASHAVTLSVTIPSGAASGDHEVLLSLPDSNANLATDPRFSIRFANDDDSSKNQGWDATRGAYRVGVIRVP
jgi:hypothetical protein